MSNPRGESRWRQRWQREGGPAEVLRVAWPLILTNSFWNLQITLDRVLLGQASSEMVAASMAAALIFWSPLTLLQFTASYSTTFVAQYAGAGRPKRVGAVIWQSLYFSGFMGFLFLGLIPLAEPIMSLAGHGPELREPEIIYFRWLCLAAIPMLINASATSFFTGLGKSRVVLFINAFGLLVNGVLAYLMIPHYGIAGAGWATAIGCLAAALLGLWLMFLREHRESYATLSAWRLDLGLMRRLLWYGLPNGLVVSFETLAFTVFVLLIDQLGTIEAAGSTIAFTLNLIVFMPALGIGQAVSVLVGQRLGENRPDLAARSTWTGLTISLTITALVTVLYLVAPQPLVSLFEPRGGSEDWPEIAALVPILLRFVVLYAFFDSANLVFSFALRGAGDTRYVSIVATLSSWLIMVVPTWWVCRQGWGLFWSWGLATAYILTLTALLLIRYLGGRWKSMRVIESSVADPDLAPSREAGAA